MLILCTLYALKEVIDLNQCPKTDLNIGMVGSIGDSVLAGYGARESPGWFNFGNFIEDRGVSSISGADPDSISWFNIIKHFEPNVTGGSYKSHFPNICSGILCYWPFNRYVKNDGLNLAATGALASDIMRQAIEFVKRVEKNYQKDSKLRHKWKIVALWIGLNDQCKYCDRKKSDIKHFETYIRQAIDYIRKHLDYVIIDLISLWNLEKLVDLSLDHPSCKSSLRQMFFKLHCKCAYGKKAVLGLKGMKAYQESQNSVLKNIANDFQSGEAWAPLQDWTGTSDNFKIIYDPSSEEMNLQDYHWSIASSTDCSHPNKHTNERLASVFWHNLFLKNNQKLKSQNWGYGRNHVRLTCPTKIQFD
eukprot:NODE_30_length_37342_cov_0.449507.p11 type:complete len:361 gc:universal NODE_30_length_37342_cov_0.449507:28698-27616(-)